MKISVSSKWPLFQSEKAALKKAQAIPKTVNKAGLLSASVYKSELKKVVDQLHLHMSDIDESLANSFPAKATQIDMGMLKKICKAASKADTAQGRKVVELSRRAYGLLIASNLHAPF